MLEILETAGFTKRILELLDEETYRRLQLELLRNPTKGAVMQGCGGIRKIRVESPRRQTGKRGGNRIIYLYVPETQHIHMIGAYGKNERDDLSASQRRTLKALSEVIRREARRSRYWRKRDGEAR